MSATRWTRDADGRYQSEHGTIQRHGGGWLVLLDKSLVTHAPDRGYIADTLREAKTVANGRIRAWLERRALLAETERRLTHYDAIMRRLNPIDQRRRP